MKYDIIIIGAGIVGLATALKILEKSPGLKLLILEKEDGVARHQTGNNSGVIHSGIYYKPGSLKAVNCRKGYKLLLEFCDTHGIGYDICGKVITAVNEEQLPQIDKIYERGIANGLEGIRKIDKKELNELEPHVNGVAAIHVPQTGIIDFKKVCDKYLEVIKNAGGEIRFGEEVTDIKNEPGDIKITTGKGTYSAGKLVTCAGLQSDRIAKKTNPELPLRIIPFRGEYYELKKESHRLINNLVYPVPDPAFPFLGVHFTRMIGGGVEAGPNAVFAFKREGYNKTDINLRDLFESLTWTGFLKVMAKYWKTGLGEYHRSFSKKAFVKALRNLAPEISGQDLVPGGAGVRAQACDKDGKLVDDFYIYGDNNIYHVCNAPSPAATASLAIGEHIAGKVMAS